MPFIFFRAKRRASLCLSALLGSTMLLTPLLAVAQQPPASTTAPPPADAAKAGMPAAADKAENKAMAGYKAYFDAKLAGLRAGLELTPAQAPLWAPVETAIRDLAKTHGMMRHAADDGAPPDMLHRLERMSDHLIQTGQAIKALTGATAPLLATLDADQKERLPHLLDGLPPRRILARAFNVADDRHADRDDEGARDHGMRRHHRFGEDRDGGHDRDGADRDRPGRDHYGDDSQGSRRGHDHRGDGRHEDRGDRMGRDGGSYDRHSDDDEDFDRGAPDRFHHGDGDHHRGHEDEERT